MNMVYKIYFGLLGILSLGNVDVVWAYNELRKIRPVYNFTTKAYIYRRLQKLR